MPRLAAFEPFRVRAYRFQWPADLLTSWAFEMETLILGWYVLVETGSVLFLTVYGALLYSGTLIAPMLGVASDRIGHRNLLSGMRAIYGGVAAAVMTCAYLGVLSPVVVCVIAAVSGIVRPSDMGLRSALIADSMPMQQLTGAMGISRTTSDSARIAGALAGTGLFAAFGIGPAYVAITVFYLLSAFLTWCAVAARIDRPPVQETAEIAERPSPWRDLREGVVHVWNTPSLLALVWFAFMVNFTAFSVTNGLMPYVAKEIYRIDQTGLGYLVASLAFGALLGSLAITQFSINIALPRLMIVSSVVWHVLLIVFAQMQTMRSGIAVLLILGVAQSVTMVCHTVTLLRASSQRFRGRVMGVRMMAIYSLPLGLLVSGTLIGRIGFSTTATLYAVIGIVFTLVIAVHWRAYLWRPEVPADQG